MNEQKTIDMMAIGSPITDLVVEVSDEFLTQIQGEKGGMELLDEEQLASLQEKLPAKGKRSPGGAAANTIFGLSKLGLKTSLVGQLGNCENGQFYRNAFLEVGGDASYLNEHPELKSALCVSLITPDAERTMRTFLGAAASFTADQVQPDFFQNCRHVHIEGYLLFNNDLIQKVMSLAKEAGCTISLDFGSFEVVRASGDKLKELLKKYADMVFANELEAEAFCGSKDPKEALQSLSEYCSIVAVKLGAEGAWLKDKDQEVFIEPVPAEKVVDSTGAGDLWAAGFLYGHHHGWSLEECGRFASIVGSHAVQHFGSHLDEEVWKSILSQKQNA